MALNNLVLLNLPADFRYESFLLGPAPRAPFCQLNPCNQQITFTKHMIQQLFPEKFVDWCFLAVSGIFGRTGKQG
ncbi:hypothetical protein BIV59_08295 [Bacillus sp. MUM 13]|nr:hypothetical protein BIV59_08295 [Bacillus sp. MUM 13]